MKKWIQRFVAVLALLLIIVAVHIYHLSGLNGNEKFPQDTFLDKVPNKTALIVVAHDDDAIGCSGTVTSLCKKGWKVYFLTFYGRWRQEDNSARKHEVANVAAIQKLAGTDLIDFSIQKSDTVKEPWMPIPYSKFPDYLKMDSLKLLIGDAIERYHPSVLFTLDNITGAYGHPEHACVSQCVIDVCNEKKNLPEFSVVKIYQSVYTRSLSENVLGDNPTYKAAKSIYHAEGMPVPDCEINIYGEAKEKMEVMSAYVSQQRNLKKVWPYYNWYPYWIYFKIFDKEYFKTITVRET